MGSIKLPNRAWRDETPRRNVMWHSGLLCSPKLSHLKRHKSPRTKIITGHAHTHTIIFLFSLNIFITFFRGLLIDMGLKPFKFIAPLLTDNICEQIVFATLSRPHRAMPHQHWYVGQLVGSGECGLAVRFYKHLRQFEASVQKRTNMWIGNLFPL